MSTAAAPTCPVTYDRPDRATKPNSDYGVTNRLCSGNVDECTVLLGPCIAALMAVSRTELAALGLGNPILAAAGPRTYANRGTTHKERDEMTDTQVTWWTQESHDRLKAELDQLIANRPVIGRGNQRSPRGG